MSQNHGRFIVFEGIDGAGKSTQITLLSKRLEAEGYTVDHSAEPTDRPTGLRIRQALAGELRATHEELAAMFLCDRIAHNVDERGIEKQVADGHIVISDRYYYSSFAYQGSFTDPDWVMDLNVNCPKIRTPDLCVFLDLSPEVSRARMEARDLKLEIYEQDLATQQAVRERFFTAFEMLKQRGVTTPIAIVDGAGTPEEIADKIYAAVQTIL